MTRNYPKHPDLQCKMDSPRWMANLVALLHEQKLPHAPANWKGFGMELHGLVASYFKLHDIPRCIGTSSKNMIKYLWNHEKPWPDTSCVCIFQPCGNNCHKLQEWFGEPTCSWLCSVPVRNLQQSSVGKNCLGPSHCVTLFPLTLMAPVLESLSILATMKPKPFRCCRFFSCFAEFCSTHLVGQ